MELECHRDVSDNYNFYLADRNIDLNNPVITVWVNDEIPDSFNSDIMCRFIEKVRDIEHIMYYLTIAKDSAEAETFKKCLPKTAGDMKDIVNYINYNKTPEKKVRLALVANADNIVIETKDVEIFKAKELGFKVDDGGK